MSALESLADAVRILDAELEQTRHYLATPAQESAQTEPSRADDGIRHGTTNAYTTHHCRCTECRAANNAYQRAYQARRKAKQAT